MPSTKAPRHAPSAELLNLQKADGKSKAKQGKTAKPNKPTVTPKSSVATARLEPAPGVEHSGLVADPQRDHRLTNRTLEFWRELAADRPYPSLSEVLEAEASELWPHLFVVKLADDTNEYAYVKCGARLVEVLGQDPTGKRLAEVLPGAARTRVLYFHRAAAAMQSPIDMSASWEAAGGEVRFRVILMPLGEGRVDHLLGCISFRHYED